MAKSMTRNHREILNILFEFWEQGIEATPKMVFDKISYTLKHHGAVRCSLGFLWRKGLVEKRFEPSRGRGKGGRRSFYKPSLSAYERFKFGTVVEVDLPDVDQPIELGDPSAL